jgi:hypothetical protein
MSQLGGKKKSAKRKPDAGKPSASRPKNRVRDQKNKGKPKRARK